MKKTFSVDKFIFAILFFLAAAYGAYKFIEDVAYPKLAEFGNYIIGQPDFKIYASLCLLAIVVVWAINLMRTNR